jgi:hypothetical protein
MDTSRFEAILSDLLGAWCDRRALNLLRVVLSSYPVGLGLTDEWANLAKALKTIRMMYGSELSDIEMDKIVEAQHFAEAIVYR